MAKKRSPIKKILLTALTFLILLVAVIIINLIIFEKNASKISTGEKIENDDQQNRALLIVDIQEVTTGDHSANVFYKKNSSALINSINQLVNLFSEKNDLILCIRSEISNPLINILNDSYSAGSDGVQFDSRLHANKGIEIIKSRNDAFYKTTLDSILIEHKVSELYIVGLDAAYCVNITSQAALNRGYEVSLIDEALLSGSTQMKDSMIMQLNALGIKTINLNSLSFNE